MQKKIQRMNFPVWKVKTKANLLDKSLTIDVITKTFNQGIVNNTMAS